MSFGIGVEKVLKLLEGFACCRKNRRKILTQEFSQPGMSVSCISAVYDSNVVIAQKSLFANLLGHFGRGIRVELVESLMENDATGLKYPEGGVGNPPCNKDRNGIQSAALQQKVANFDTIRVEPVVFVGSGC